MLGFLAVLAFALIVAFAPFIVVMVLFGKYWPEATFGEIAPYIVVGYLGEIVAFLTH